MIFTAHELFIANTAFLNDFRDLHWPTLPGLNYYFVNTTQRAFSSLVLRFILAKNYTFCMLFLENKVRLVLISGKRIMLHVPSFRLFNFVLLFLCQKYI